MNQNSKEILIGYLETAYDFCKQGISLDSPEWSGLKKLVIEEVEEIIKEGNND